MTFEARTHLKMLNAKSCLGCLLVVLILLVVGCRPAVPPCNGGLCGKQVSSGKAQYAAEDKVSQVMTVPVAGKITVIDFWDTDCQPCLEAMPRWEALWQQLDKGRATLVSVALDQEIDPVRRTLKEDQRLVGISFPVLHDGADELGELYEVGATRPLVVIVDDKGMVLYDSRSESGDHVDRAEQLLTQLGVMQ